MQKSQKLKIVHVVDYFQPQLGYQEASLAKEHAKMGHDVYVVTSDRYFPFPDYQSTYNKLLGNRICGKGEFKENGYKVIRLEPIFELPALPIIPKYKNVLKQLNPDIVIHHNLFSLNLYWTLQAKKNSQFKLIADSHAAEYNTNFRSFNRKLYLKFWKLLCQKNLNRFGTIITTGKDEDLFFKNATKGIKTKIIPLGADINKFEFNYKHREEIRKLLGVTNQEILIIHAGKINSSKKTLELVKAFIQLKNKNRKIKLIIIGNGPNDYINNIKRTINKNNCNDYVIFKNFMSNDDLNKYISAADIGIWPGSKSNIFTEAIACGLPVILEDREYARDLTKNGNGFNVTSNKELVEKLEKLIKQPLLRNKMGVKSRELAKLEYSWAKISQQFLTL